MCGRYTLADPENLADYYGFQIPDAVRPNYNAAHFYRLLVFGIALK